jgi:hypothetical protein
MANWNKWIEVVDCIFVNKDKYAELTDDDKINSFFKINRKFAFKYPKVAQFLNSRSIDKASAVDQWFILFKDQKGIPGWYWKTKSKKETEKVKKSKTYDKIAERYELKESEMKFLIKYFSKDLDKELKQIEFYEKDE